MARVGHDAQNDSPVLLRCAVLCMTASKPESMRKHACPLQHDCCHLSNKATRSLLPLGLTITEQIAAELQALQLCDRRLWEKDYIDASRERTRQRLLHTRLGIH